MAQAGKKPKGQRPKHIPQRTCIACRRVDPKRALVRLVRDTDGRVVIDTTGKRAGRGAYLCHDPACWEQALRRRGLERALRLDALHPDDRVALDEFAQSLPPVAPELPVSE
jgi:predicted RNA-binding protein YlxR (DUF448 family)